MCTWVKIGVAVFFRLKGDRNVAVNRLDFLNLNDTWSIS